MDLRHLKEIWVALVVFFIFITVILVLNWNLDKGWDSIILLCVDAILFIGIAGISFLLFKEFKEIRRERKRRYLT